MSSKKNWWKPPPYALQKHTNRNGELICVKYKLEFDDTNINLTLCGDVIIDFFIKKEANYSGNMHFLSQEEFELLKPVYNTIKILYLDFLLNSIEKHNETSIEEREYAWKNIEKANYNSGFLQDLMFSEILLGGYTNLK